MPPTTDLFHPPLPTKPGLRHQWCGLRGSSRALALTRAAVAHPGPLLLVTADTREANRLAGELAVFGRELGADTDVHHFPDWETLPYDAFSPHQDIVSDRLTTLFKLPSLKRGVVILPIATLMQRVAPRGFLDAGTLILDLGDTLDPAPTRGRLEQAGYCCVTTVMEHGEFALRGGILDLFPMGSREPFRIELFDDEVESIRTFDPETQRSREKVDRIRLLPAREFPLDAAGRDRFRQRWLDSFDDGTTASPVYREVRKGIAPPGIEYYLPLFFDATATLFDYLPGNTLITVTADVGARAELFWREIGERYENHRHNPERPLLPPAELYLEPQALFAAWKAFARVELHTGELPPAAGVTDFATGDPPEVAIDARSKQPLGALSSFLAAFDGRVLLAAETAGRRETLLKTLAGAGIKPKPAVGWQAFVDGSDRLAITVAPLEHGLVLERAGPGQTGPDQTGLAVIAEPQLFGDQVMQRRRRRKSNRDPDAVVRNLTELNPGAPVVHEDYGVGRYLGLQTLDIGGITTEYLTLEYYGGEKVYVPVANLHLVSRYTGVDPEHAPLHRLGSGKWEKAKRKAAEKVRDVAAELLDVYARRAAQEGRALPIDQEDYAAFTAGFPFETTPDQQDAIDAVLNDIQSKRPMDRVICGDVGFGKTEVAMRAAFIAVQAGYQVALLVPTTLLAQQHLQSFSDRFADWPVRVEGLSRFRTKKQIDGVLADLVTGQVDIVIGTHTLLQDRIKFKALGLAILDEEHRFGVRQKERLKALRTEVDVLTLTATPIPRTLNFSLSGLRDLSIIATPPAGRLAIKTFIQEWDNAKLREAMLREIHRGGQVYFLHNKVETIEQTAREVEAILPEGEVRIAHGQMHERDLERVMLDFYHQRFNVLVCTTIIETGIDVPSANTIIMNRADRLGLAQLYQLRGRVGRSHHRAYAYLIVPHKSSISADAKKRLEAIEALEDLGMGFTLATHDMEIRGAGELLGENQSGQMQQIGYTLYTEMLHRAVEALKAGTDPDLAAPLDHGAEVDLHIPALIPEDYLGDVHTRLIIYKRIAGCDNFEALHELQVELIDRFGLLPEPTKALFAVNEIKLMARPLGIKKVEAGPHGGRILFQPEPNIDPMKLIKLVQTQPQTYKLDGQDKLRVVRALPDAAARIAEMEGLLRTLAGKA